ncbi:MAG: VWA domain-containing protein [Candidatus Schekmanbacteria bacterium]|nr:VWA domain-containing protein [Candidatus Schekmanbacteria bacterium]
MMRTLLALLMLACLPASALPAAPAESPADRLDISVSTVHVRVPVTVVDSRGRPVRGLTASDFALTDDRVDQEITSFEAVDLQSSEAAELVRNLPAARRNILFLFDLSNSTMKGILEARAAALGAVASLLPTDSAAVMVASSGGIRFELAFTHDRDQLRRALTNVGIETGGVRRDPLALFLDVMENQNAATSLTPLQHDDPISKGGTGGGGDAGGQLGAVAASGKRMGEREIQDRAADWASELAAVGLTLNAIDGRKHVLLFSAGVPDEALVGSQSLSETTAAVESNIWGAGSLESGNGDAIFGAAGVKTALAKAVEQLQRADVVVHCVDTSLLVAGGAMGLPEGSGRGQASLHMVAEDTGGNLWKNANDLSVPLAEIVERSRYTYVVGFESKEQRGAGQYHKLALELRKDTNGWRVIHRPGYFEPRPFTALTAIERQLLASEQIVSGIVASDIPLDVVAAPLVPGKNRTGVFTVVELPEILRREPAKQLDLELYGYARKLSGEVLAFFSDRVSFDVELARSQNKAGGVKLIARLDVPAGDAELVFLARNARTGATGLGRQTLRVPDLASGAPGILSPLFVDASSSWIVRRSSSIPEGDAYPFTVLGSSFLPAAAPATAGSAYRACLTTFGLSAAAAAGQVDISGRLVDSFGRPVRGATFRVVGKATASDSSGRVDFLLVIEAGDATHGPHSVEIAAQAPGMPPQRLIAPLGVDRTAAVAVAATE